MSNAMLGYGSKFEISSGVSSPTDFVSVGEVYNITPPSSVIDTIDVTHMQSPNRRREYISGLIDYGECSFELNFIPGSPGDLELIEMLTLPLGVSRKRQARIRYPNGWTDNFEVELSNYEPTVPTDDRMTATVTFKVTGDVTRSFQT